MRNEHPRHAVLIAALILGAISGGALLVADVPPPAQPETANSSPVTSPKPQPPPATRGSKHLPPKPSRIQPINLHRIFEERVPEVIFDETPLQEVIDWLRDYTGAAVATRWSALEQVGISRNQPISLRAKDKTLSSILWAIVNESAGPGGDVLAYERTDDTLLLSTDLDLGRVLVTRIYNVRDVLVDLPRFPRYGPQGRIYRTRVRRAAPAASPGDESGSKRARATSLVPADESKDERERLIEFVELVVNSIEPDSWEINQRNGAGTITTYGGRIVVTNSIKVHQLIEGALHEEPDEPARK